MKQALFAKSI